MDYLIYTATSPSGKIYVGLTSKTLEVRKKQHAKASKYKRDNPRFSRFQNAIKKYGSEMLKWEILEKNLTMDEAIFLEKYYIKNYNSMCRKRGYNSNGGGVGNFKHGCDKTKRKARKNFKIARGFENCPQFKKYWEQNPEKRKLYGLKTMENLELRALATENLNKYREIAQVPIVINNLINFKTTKAAALFIGCSPQSIRFALKNSGIVKGFNVKRGSK